MSWTVSDPKNWRGHVVIVDSKETAVAWLALHCIPFFQLGFHPDTRAEEYTYTDARPCFVGGQITRYNDNMRRVFMALDDPYAISIAIWKAYKLTEVTDEKTVG